MKGIGILRNTTRSILLAGLMCGQLPLCTHKQALAEPAARQDKPVRERKRAGAACPGV